MLFVASETQTIRSLRFLQRVPDGAARLRNFTGADSGSVMPTGDGTAMIPPHRM
jgi:hypothetical protein